MKENEIRAPRKRQVEKGRRRRQDALMDSSNDYENQVREQEEVAAHEKRTKTAVPSCHGDIEANTQI